MDNQEYNFDEEMDYIEDQQEEKKKKKRILLIIFAILLIVLGSVYFGFYLYEQYSAQQGESELSAIAKTTVASNTDNSLNAVENPIDFDSLKAMNSDIYAWIVVPNTKVDYPIVQHPTDNAFYLKHDALTKKWQSSGAVYTEHVNNTDFNDMLTVIYGHNGYGDTMFTTLHYFENEEFFNQNEYFYIYTEDSKLTYQIVSAFKYDDRHLMYAFNLQDLAVRDQFVAMIQNPDSSNKNVRGELDKEITRNDNIVVLSTCITNQKSSRYLVCGVLVKNEQTY